MEQNYFDKFWALYPNKKAKGAARTAWQKKVKESGDEAAFYLDIELAIDAQKRWRQRENAQNKFVPNWKHPSVWLNQECWLDEIPSQIEEENKTDLNTRTCTVCNKQTYGQRFSLCEYHLSFTSDDKLYGTYSDELRAQFQKNQIDPQRGSECLQVAKRILGGGRSR